MPIVSEDEMAQLLAIRCMDQPDNLVKVLGRPKEYGKAVGEFYKSLLATIKGQSG